MKNYRFKTKEKALKFISKVSFRDWYQKVTIQYRNKNWLVCVERVE